MADVSMEIFLMQYYMQLHFNNMPAEVFAQFQDYAKKDDFRGNMKHWKKHLMDLVGLHLTTFSILMNRLWKVYFCM